MIWSHTREARGEQLASSHGNETEDESELKGNTCCESKESYKCLVDGVHLVLLAGNLYEGDMILTERQWALLRQESKVDSGDRGRRDRRSTENLVAGSFVLTWPNAVVPYVFSAILGKFDYEMW